MTAAHRRHSDVMADTTHVGAPAGIVSGVAAVDPPTGEVTLVAVSSRIPGGIGQGPQGVSQGLEGVSQGNVSLVVGDQHGVVEQRRRLLASVGSDLARGVAMEQVHGGAVAVVGSADAGRGMLDHDQAVSGVDGLVTFETDIALMVMVADCVPLLLVDPGHGVAAVHAGRRGTAAGITGTAVNVLTAVPERVHAVIGPAIGGCCYEVPPAMVDAVASDHPDARSTTTWGTPSLDLPAAIAAQLHVAGVTDVRRMDVCTRCASPRWFSHRADPRRGRQAAVVVRRSTAAPSRRSQTLAEVASVDASAFLDWSA